MKPYRRPKDLPPHRATTPFQKALVRLRGTDPFDALFE